MKRANDRWMGRERLVNLDADPREEPNLADDPSQEALLGTWRATLIDH